MLPVHSHYLLISSISGMALPEAVDFDNRSTFNRALLCVLAISQQA